MSYRIRGGIRTDDYRLDRIPSHDPRNHEFPVRHAIAKAAKPRSYTWSCPINLDQGKDGACVGFGIAHELAAKPVVVRGITDQFALKRIYWEAQKIDGWEGGAYPGAKPFYEGTSVLAGVKVAHAMGAMESYRWAYTLPDLVLGVGYAGPAVIGVDWYEGMFDPDSSGFLHATGRVAGGHCTLIVGVSLPRQAFRIHNSWGKGWGEAGRAWLPFTDMERLLRNGGEACFFVGRKIIAPQ